MRKKSGRCFVKIGHNMKIAIRTDINNRIGTGHYMRMSTLAEAFLQLGCECKFYKSEDEPVNYSVYDIIIVDSYELNDAFISSLNSYGGLVVCWDDNALYNYHCDVIVNANLYAHELKFRFMKSLPRLLLGGKYALLRKDIRAAMPVEIRENAMRIFICFGGSDPYNLTSRVIQTLSAIDNIHLIAALGTHTNNDKEVFSLESDKVFVYKTPKNLPEIISSCDIAVTASGTMVYELASIGIPSILISQADNQMRIAEYMTRSGLMKSIGTWKDFNSEILHKETLALLQNFEKRREQSMQLRKCVDKNGAMNAAREILNMVS